MNKEDIVNYEHKKNISSDEQHEALIMSMTLVTNTRIENELAFWEKKFRLPIGCNQFDKAE